MGGRGDVASPILTILVESVDRCHPPRYYQIMNNAQNTNANTAAADLVLMVSTLSATSAPESRVTTFALAAAYGNNAGMYKVQAVCLATDTIIQEWN